LWCLLFQYILRFFFDTALQKSGGPVPPGPPVSTPLIILACRSAGGRLPLYFTLHLKILHLWYPCAATLLLNLICPSLGLPSSSFSLLKNTVVLFVHLCCCIQASCFTHFHLVISLLFLMYTHYVVQGQGTYQLFRLFPTRGCY